MQADGQEGILGPAGQPLPQAYPAFAQHRQDWMQHLLHIERLESGAGAAFAFKQWTTDGYSGAHHPSTGSGSRC